ncbi:Topoisomerase IV subunit A [Clostridiaceae bacterium JG1575]|nr:Topoisomerase IV subunit A [Clostridiaceae bacterium JG1575]
MAKKELLKDQNIIELPLEEAMPDNYLPYAVEVAKDRALPDVRDGLKPVHRRILYGAYLLKAFPDRPTMKSARIVGDIMGKFHPHGDASVYDAMTILAQDFSTRVPLIEGQGNWGSMDGDPAAAMRYTEARLSQAAMALLRDIDKETVAFVPNYSDSEWEPTVLPARFPNLLVNGSFGIAVGLSTNIPSHNLAEVIEATCALIDDPNLTVPQLMKHMPGPDLPTGGILIGRQGLQKAYETGEGKAVLRAKTEIEKLDNGRLGIVITEFPYRKNKARILQTISEMTGDKKHQKTLEAITDIRDESGRAGIRGVVELRRSATMEDADRILKYLLKKTDLQSNLNFNMVAIDHGKPVTLGLREMLLAYITHQSEVLTRRTQKELDQALRRFHLVEGFMRALEVMDELIALIRASKNKTDASGNIQERFGFTQEQAAAILELMLYRLTGLEMEAFLKEHRELKARIKRLQAILKDPRVLDALLKEELGAVKQEFQEPRRTQLIADEEEATIHVEELLVVEDAMVTLSREGFIKALPLKSYHRSSADPALVDYREGDSMAAQFLTNTVNQILIFTNFGQLYQFESQKIPEMRWKDKGVRFDELLRTRLSDQERVVAAFSLPRMGEAMVFKLITDRGGIKRTLGSAYESKYTKLVALKLAKGEELFAVILEEGLQLIDHRLPSLISPLEEPLSPPSMICRVISDDMEEDFGDMGGREYQSLPSYVRIETENGLRFTVPEGACDVKDKMILPERFALIPPKDRIKELRYEFDYEAQSVELEVSAQGSVRPLKGRRRTKGSVLLGDSQSMFLFITSDGMAHRLPGYLFESLTDARFLSDFFAFDGAVQRLAGAFSLDLLTLEEPQVLLGTSRGLIKRMERSEFLLASDEFPVVKFRSSGETLAFALSLEDPKENLLLISQRGMAIQFSVQAVPVLGRMAGGVLGISLKEEDELAFAALDSRYKTLGIQTNRGGKAEIDLAGIRTQNRAGKGTCILKMVLDERIDEVTGK